MAEEKLDLTTKQGKNEIMLFKVLTLLDRSYVLSNRIKKVWEGFEGIEQIEIMNAFTKLGICSMLLGRDEIDDVIRNFQQLEDTPVECFADPSTLDPDRFEFLTAVAQLVGNMYLNNVFQTDCPIKKTLRIYQKLEEQGNPVFLHSIEDMLRSPEQLIVVLNELKTLQMKYPKQKMVFNLASGWGGSIALCYSVAEDYWSLMNVHLGMEDLEYRSTETLASKVFRLFSPQEAHDMPYVVEMEKRITQIPDLARELREMSDVNHLFWPYSMRYDFRTERFSLSKSAEPALFEMKIYSLSAIRFQLEQYFQEIERLQDLDPSSEALAIRITHKMHQIDIKYSPGQWVISNDAIEVSHFAHRREAAAWILDRFAEYSKDAITSITAESHLGRQQIEDPTTTTLIQELQSLESIKPKLDEGLATKRDMHGNTLLFLCTMNRNYSAMHDLLLNGADPNNTNLYNSSPLSVAWVFNDSESIEVLMQHGADPRAVLKATPNIISALVIRRNYKIVELLLERYEVDPNIKMGQFSLLFLASMRNDLKMVRLLKKYQVAPHPEEKQVDYMPFFAAAEKGHCETVEYFLTEGKMSVMEKMNDNEDTALHIAAQNGHDNLVALLLERKAEPNNSNRQGLTPVQAALNVQPPNPRVVKLLLESKVDPDQINVGRGTLTLLMSAAVDDNFSCLQLLIAAKANLDLTDAQGATALHYAALRGKDNIAKQLLESKASHLNADGHLGTTPLHWAAESLQLETVRVLLDLKAEPNRQAAGVQNTALHQTLCTLPANPAVIDPNLIKRQEVIRLLLERKADPDLQNREGLSFRFFARGTNPGFADCLDAVPKLDP